MQTPWGRSDNIEPRGDRGILWVSTPSHGGFYVPPAMLNDIPRAWREASFNKQGLRGWFEEDVDWCMVMLCIPGLFEGAEQAAHMQAAQATFDSWIAPKLNGGSST